MSTAICWTLVHSIWQGLFLSLITGIVLAATRTSRPTLRYNLLSGLLLLFVAISGLTFIYEWQSVPASSGVAAIIYSRLTGSYPVAGNFTTDMNWMQSLVQWINSNAWLIISVWLCILGYRLLRIAYSVVYTNHIRNHRSTPPSREWQDRLIRLSDRLSVSRPVQLLESGIIKMPAVFGHWKPVIFIPAGLLAQLPPDELEAILAHELAHIRRSDFLVNLLQNIVEAIFFFNPAIRWLSARIRQEREHCCDDMAIAGTGDRKGLVRALVSFKQFSAAQTSSVAVGFPGDRDSFLNRIARIVHRKNRTVNPVEGVFLAVSLVIVGVLSIAFVRHDSPKEQPSVRPPLQVRSGGARPAVERTAVDTVPSNDPSIKVRMGDANTNDTIITNRNGHRYRLILTETGITGLNVDGREIPREEIGKYRPVTESILRNVSQLQNDEKQEQADKQRLEIEMKERDAALRQLAIDQKRMEKEQIEMEGMEKEQMEKERNEMLKKEVELKRDQEQQAKDQEAMLKAQLQEQSDKEQMGKDLEKLEKDKLTEETTRSIIFDILKDRLVKSEKGLDSFFLSSGVFVINGKPQPDEILQRYKSKYIHEAAEQYSFSSSRFRPSKPH